MEDLRNGIRYVIRGIENQYAFDCTTPFKVMGYDYTSYDRQIENFKAQSKKDDIETYASGLLPEQKLAPVITLILYYGDDDLPDNICAMLNMLKESSQTLLHTRDTLFTLAAITKDQRY